jgi:hypothetical protein
MGAPYIFYNGVRNCVTRQCVVQMTEYALKKEQVAVARFGVSGHVSGHVAQNTEKQQAPYFI